MDVRDMGKVMGGEQIIYGIFGIDDTVLTFTMRLQSDTEVSNRIKDLLRSIGITKGSDDVK